MTQVDMTQDVTLDAALVTSTPDVRSESRLLAAGTFILVVGVVAIAALVSDSSFTPDQRIQVFQQSGMYP